MPKQELGFCDKCGTFAKLVDLDDRELCTVNSCYDEELEKLSPKIEEDRQSIDKLKQLMDSTRAETYTSGG
jgi:hypothetical protein